MSENILKTRFVFDDAQDVKVDALRQKILSTNNDFDNLGKNLIFGKTITDNSELAGKSVETLKKKVDDFKTTTDNISLKPTISRHWENEANQITASVKKAENAIDNLKGKNSSGFQPVGFTIPNAAPTAKPTFTDFDALEKKTAETGKAFQSIAAARLDSGQINNLTKDIVRASERSRQLTNDIFSIKKELQNPNRKSSIAFLTDELRGAEKEAELLNKKLSTLPTSGGNKSGGRGRKGLGETGRAVLEFADDFVPAGFNKPFNAAVKGLAQTSFSAAGIGLIASAAAAGAVVVKISYDIKERAEQLLKTQEKITSELNKQLLAAKELKDAFDKSRKDAAEASRVQFFQQITPIEQIRGRKDLLDKLTTLVPNSTNIENYRKELSTLEAQITAFDQKKLLEKRSEPDRVFSENFENRRKAEEADRLIQEKNYKELIEKQKKFAEAVKDGKEKAKEFGKTIDGVFDNLYEKANAQNSFVQVFSEANRALKTLKENIKSLPPELQKSALALQNKINLNALFETRLETGLKAQDLRFQAEDIRNFDKNRLSDFSRNFQSNLTDALVENFNGQNPLDTQTILKKLEKAEVSKVLSAQVSALIEEGLKRQMILNNRGINKTFGGLNPRPDIGLTEQVTTAKFGNKTTSYRYDAAKGLFNSYDQLANGGTFSRQKTYEDLTSSEKIQFLDSVKKVDDRKITFQNRLDQQIGLANSLARQEGTQDALSIANRKINALTQGIDFAQLRPDQRTEIALSREREATRVFESEKEAREERKKEIENSTKMVEYLAALVKIAEKEGLKGVQQALEIKVKDNTSSGVNVTDATPTNVDTQAFYTPSLVSGSGGLTNY